MDSHTPYRQLPIDGRRRSGRRIEFPYTGMAMTAEEAEDVRARYEAGIRSADAETGRLVAALAASGRPLLGIVTSDHGESLGESGRWFHGGTLAPELLAIPLLVWGDDTPPGRMTTPVGHEAIRSTLLAAAGLPCPDCLGPDLRSGGGDGIIEGGLPPSLIYRITDRFKLVIDLGDGSRHLFDLQRDPGEVKDISGRRPEIAEKLAGATAAARSGACSPSRGAAGETPYARVYRVAGCEATRLVVTPKE